MGQSRDERERAMRKMLRSSGQLQFVFAFPPTTSQALVLFG